MVEYIVAIDVTRVRFPADALIWSFTAVLNFLLIKLFSCAQVRDSIVVSISACHADDPGSIPGRGEPSCAQGASAASGFTSRF